MFYTCPTLWLFLLFLSSFWMINISSFILFFLLVLIWMLYTLYSLFRGCLVNLNTHKSYLNLKFKSQSLPYFRIISRPQFLIIQIYMLLFSHDFSSVSKSEIPQIRHYFLIFNTNTVCLYLPTQWLFFPSLSLFLGTSYFFFSGVIPVLPEILSIL